MPTTRPTPRRIARTRSSGRRLIELLLRFVGVALLPGPPDADQLVHAEEQRRQDYQQDPTERSAHPVQEVAEVPHVILHAPECAAGRDLPALYAGVRVALRDDGDDALVARG